MTVYPEALNALEPPASMSGVKNGFKWGSSPACWLPTPGTQDPTLVVGIGILGNLAVYPILDPIAALIVGFLVGKMRWTFGWQALHDLMDRSADVLEVEAMRTTLLEMPGVHGLHDLRSGKMVDLIVVDAHLEVDAAITVQAGHDIAVAARERVLQRHRVLNLMTHIDPFRQPDLDHSAVTTRSTAATVDVDVA